MVTCTRLRICSAGSNLLRRNILKPVPFSGTPSSNVILSLTTRHGPRSFVTIRATQSGVKFSSFRGMTGALTAAAVGSLLWYRYSISSEVTRNDSIDITVKKDLSKVNDSDPMRLRMEAFVKDSQRQIISALEALEPEGKFRIDTWTRPEGGDGISAVLQDGKVFEKAGVMVSVVHGKLGAAAVEKMRADHSKIQANPSGQTPFFACGLSLVLHPVNPHAPTVHMNYRFFEIQNADGTTSSWFGGGTDLTPTYLYNEDAIHFHKTLKDTCDRHDKRYYPDFKKWCDKYFFIEHRKEARGIGGIFFDDLDDRDPNEIFSFVKDACSSFLPCYLPIIERRKDTPYTQAQKAWQQIRRGRYVEFNLVLDRGTQFGLRTPGARIESILMSLPLTARWEYMHSVEPNSKEDRLLQVLRQPQDWV